MGKQKQRFDLRFTNRGTIVIKLSPEAVNALIAAGRDALRTNPTFHAFLGGIDGKLLTAASTPRE